MYARGKFLWEKFARLAWEKKKKKEEVSGGLAFIATDSY